MTTSMPKHSIPELVSYSLVHQAPLGFALFDAEFCCRLINPMLAAIDGNTVETAYGQPFERLFPSWAKPFKNRLEQMQNSVEPLIQIEKRFLHESEASSNTYWLIAAYPRHDPQQQFLGFGMVVLAVRRDTMTALLETGTPDQAHPDEQTIYSQTRHAVEEALRGRDMLFSIVAHELRTPLTILVGYSQLLQRRLGQHHNIDARDQRALKVLHQQAERLNRTILALLDFSRLQDGHIPIRQQPIELSSLVERMVDESSVLLEQHTIFTQFHSLPVWVIGDELRLEQVLQQLLQNAIKYSPQGGIILVSLTEQDGNALIEIQDHGIGIPREALPKLFSRFYRADNAEARRLSGIGIGLHIVRELIEAHGGQVSVESVENEGSTFRLMLPLMAN